MRPATLIIAAVVLAFQARPAHSQTIDVGGGVSTTKFVDGGDAYASVGPTITVHFTGRHAIQLLTDINVRRWAYNGTRYQDIRGVYFLQYRHTFGSPARRVKPSISAGLAGGVERH